MFGTLGNSFRLLLISARILFGDGQLMLFPLMTAGALFVVFGYTGIVLWAGGTFDRIGPDYSFAIADGVFLLIAYFLASFAMVYTTAALSAAAYQRLEGFTPDMQTGVNAANDQIGALGGWSVLSATAIALLNELSDRRSLTGRLFGVILRTFWNNVTFFVIPVIVIESANPMQAVSRSTEIFRGNWGRTMIANYGFGMAYVLALLLALGPAAALYFALGSQFLGVTVGVMLAALGIATVKALDTVYRVTLYDYAATGRVDFSYADSMVRDAYVSKEDRGSFRRNEVERPRSRAA